MNQKIKIESQKESSTPKNIFFQGFLSAKGINYFN
jgi:hypothetical protein